MAKIEQFDIEPGKKWRELTKQIYEITSIGEFKRDFGLKDQLSKASVSILSMRRSSSETLSRSRPRLSSARSIC
jgi:four helix bundle protein